MNNSSSQYFYLYLFTRLKHLPPPLLPALFPSKNNHSIFPEKYKEIKIIYLVSICHSLLGIRVRIGTQYH